MTNTGQYVYILSLHILLRFADGSSCYCYDFYKGRFYNALPFTRSIRHDQCLKKNVTELCSQLISIFPIHTTEVQYDSSVDRKNYYTWCLY